MVDELKRKTAWESDFKGAGINLAVFKTVNYLKIGFTKSNYELFVEVGRTLKLKHDVKELVPLFIRHIRTLQIEEIIGIYFEKIPDLNQRISHPDWKVIDKYENTNWDEDLEAIEKISNYLMVAPNFLLNRILSCYRRNLPLKNIIYLLFPEKQDEETRNFEEFINDDHSQAVINEAIEGKKEVESIKNRVGSIENRITRMETLLENIAEQVGADLTGTSE